MTSPMRDQDQGEDVTGRQEKRPMMTPGTRRVHEEWPDYWMDWGEAAFQVERKLNMTRREVANRAAWLVKHGYIRRCWVEIWSAPGEPQQPMAFIGKRVPDPSFGEA